MMSCFGFEVYKILGAPPPPLLAQHCFQSFSFGCLKTFGATINIFIPPCHIKWTFPCCGTWSIKLYQLDLLSGLFTLISLFKRAPASEPIGNVALLVDSVELGIYILYAWLWSIEISQMLLKIEINGSEVKASKTSFDFINTWQIILIK